MVTFINHLLTYLQSQSIQLKIKYTDNIHVNEKYMKVGQIERWVDSFKEDLQQRWGYV